MNWWLRQASPWRCAHERISRLARQEASPLVGIVEKVCTKCGQTKPLEAFARRSERRGGRVSRCKACASAENKTWRELQLAKHGYKQPWRNVPRLDGMKVCRTCLEAKPLEEFTTRTGLE